MKGFTMKHKGATSATSSSKHARLPETGSHGNRNFGRDDHHGTTNVRSKHANSLPGTGGSRHIDKAMPISGMGRHVNSTIQVPPPQGVSSVPGVQEPDADDMPSMLSSVPLHSSEGGFG